MPTSRRAFNALLLAAAGAGLFPSVAGSVASSRRPAQVVVGFATTAFTALEPNGPHGIVLQAVDSVLTGLSVPARYLLLPQDDLLGALNAGRIDMAAALAPEDAGSFDMSPAMVMDWDVVAAPAGREFALSSLADLAGKRLGVRGSRPLELLDTAEGIQLRRFGRDSEMLRDLVNGRLDGVVVRAFGDVAMLRTHGVLPRLRLLAAAVGQVPLSAALSRARLSPGFISDFHLGMAELIASERWQPLVQAAAPMEMARPWRLLDGGSRQAAGSST